jgi:hypothetical protein
MSHKKSARVIHRKRTVRAEKIVAPLPTVSTAILIGNSVTTSAELPTIVSNGVVYSRGILGIGPSENASERNAKTL